jgi:hypothetical protein
LFIVAATGLDIDANTVAADLIVTAVRISLTFQGSPRVKHRPGVVNTANARARIKLRRAVFRVAFLVNADMVHKVATEIFYAAIDVFIAGRILSFKSRWASCEQQTKHKAKNRKQTHRASTWRILPGAVLGRQAASQSSSV